MNKYIEKKRMVIIGAIAVVLGMGVLTICAKESGIFWWWMVVDRITSLICFIVGALSFREWKLTEEEEKIAEYKKWEKEDNNLKKG